jgi:hypothetical protein
VASERGNTNFRPGGCEFSVSNDRAKGKGNDLSSINSDMEKQIIKINGRVGEELSKPFAWKVNHSRQNTLKISAEKALLNIRYIIGNILTLTYYSKVNLYFSL